MAEVEDWRKKFRLSSEKALRSRPRDKAAPKDEQIKKLKQKRWLVHHRSSTPRPRVRGWISRVSRSNERWAMDVVPSLTTLGQTGMDLSGALHD